MDTIEQSDGIKVTFRDFLNKYIRYLPLFIISVIVCVALAYIYIRYATPIYNSKATLLIKKDKNPYGAANEEFESIFLYKGGNDIDDEIEIIKSKNIAKRVVKKLGLQTMYYVVGNVKTSLLYPNCPFQLKVLKLYDTTATVALSIKLISDDEFTLDKGKTHFSFNKPFRIGSSEFILSKKDTVFNQLNYKEFLITYQSEQSAADYLSGGLQVSPIKDRSNVLLLSYQGIQPELGIDILNHLMEEYKTSSIEDKNQIAIQTNNFINKRLSIIADELGDVEKNLQNFKQKNQVINLGVQSDLSLNNQSDLEKQLTEQEIKLNIINFLQEYLNDTNNKFNIVPSSLGIEEPVFVQLVKNYNELQLRRESESKTTPRTNPLIISLEIQLEKLRVDMKENLRNLLVAVKLVRDQAQRKINSYQSSISSIPIKEKDLLDITRQQGIKQSLYLYLLQKREETAISLASTISNSQVLDYALSSHNPISPKPFNIKLISVCIGLLLPALFIYLREILNDKLGSREDIEKVTQAPIFGEIGHSDDPDALVMKRNTRNIISEQFRMVRANLQYLVGNKDKSVILVTSTFSGEGKSFVSINVGAVMALAGKKTVIIELDIRKPKIVSGLNLKKSSGITNYIFGNEDISSLPVAVPDVDNLYVIPCGAIPPNPAEVLLEEKLRDIFDFAKKEFDMVIVDTAPIGLVSDAQVLGNYADCTFYIVRLNYTLKKHVHFIDDIYQSNKLPKIGILVNDIKSNSPYYSYGNYNGYGYGYSYGNSYFDNGDGGQSRSWIRRLFNKLPKKK